MAICTTGSNDPDERLDDQTTSLQPANRLADISLIAGGIGCALLALQGLVRVIAVLSSSGITTIGIIWLCGAHFGITFPKPKSIRRFRRTQIQVLSVEGQDGLLPTAENVPLWE